MRTTPSRFNAFTAAGDPAERGYEAAPPPALPPPPPPLDLSAIEKHHPAVTRALTLLWGRPEMNQYFQKVASGLDPALNLLPAAMAELLLLAEIHRRICPYQPAKSVEELYGKGRWADTWKPARHRG